MQLLASLYKVQVDNEGESKVILVIPQSELSQVLELTQLTQKLLKITIEVEEI